MSNPIDDLVVDETAASRRHVMVVDDDGPSRRAVARQLARAGYEVVMAESGPSALDIVRPDVQDVVLLDVRMPGMDGFETCQRLRAIPGGSDLLIVFLTGDADQQNYDRALESGADDFLFKPVRALELVIRVRSLIRLKKLQKQLEHSNQVIRSQRDQLILAQERKRRLTAMIVHDLKSPLAAVLAQCHYLTMLERSPAVDDTAKAVLHSADAMHRMVLDLLDVDRSEDGALAPRLALMSLADLFSECEAWVRGLSFGRCRVTYSLGAGAETLVADADLLRRVVTNLVENSMKYAPAGSEITVESRAIEGDQMELAIRDLGPGIPAEFRELIFEPYSRLARDQAAHARTSRGLGLAFCKLALEAHGGRIWVEDNAPQGSAFKLVLPRRTGHGLSPTKPGGGAASPPFLPNNAPLPAEQYQRDKPRDPKG